MLGHSGHSVKHDTSRQYGVSVKPKESFPYVMLYILSVLFGQGTALVILIGYVADAYNFDLPLKQTLTTPAHG